MVITGAEKFSLVKELNAIRLSLPPQNGAGKLKSAKRINEIRVLLSIDSSSEKGLELDINDLAKSIESMRDYVENNLSSMPIALRKSEVETLKKVLYLVCNGVSSDHKSTNDARNLLISIEQIDTQTDETALNHFSSFSKDINFDKAGGYSEAWVDELKIAKETFYDSTPENVKKILELGELQEDLWGEANKLSSDRKTNAGEGNFAGWGNNLVIDVEALSESQKLRNQELLDKYNALKVKIGEIGDEIIQLRNEKHIDRDKKIAFAENKLKSVGEPIIADLLEQSPITQEQAETWANAQIIDKSSIARLQKQGYKKEDVRKDMAEFYRISGGKLRRIDIIANGSKRANAGGIGEVEGVEIHVGSSFDKRVLWHELAHHLEADPAAKQASNEFLIKRRESDTVYSLASLTGNRGYGKNEGAYKDSFINEYVGKVYRDGVTEVFSMGVENLSDPIKLATMIAKDSEMAAMIIGYLKADLSPATKALQKLQDSKAGDNQAKRDDKQNEYQNAIEKLAAQVTLVNDDWFEGLDDDSKKHLISGQYYSLNDDKAKFVGSWGEYHVFSGAFVSRKTKRKTKGFSVCKCNRGVSLILSEGNYDGYGRRAFQDAPFYMLGSDLMQVKAMLNICKNELEGDLSRAMYNLYVFNGENENQREFIKYANKILGTPNE